MLPLPLLDAAAPVPARVNVTLGRQQGQQGASRLGSSA